MPSKTPDIGIQRFDMRTGLNGVTTLGGMFRSGDPGVIPQHKHHLMVNMRITPAGAISRPGLAEVYDTTVEECIPGLTSDGERYSTMILWPGATYGNNDFSMFGAPDLSQVTFRAIFPRSGDPSYSEFINVLWDSNPLTTGGNYPTIGAYDAPAGDSVYGTDAYGRMYAPFIYRGRVCCFTLLPRRENLSGTIAPAWALLMMDLPTRSKQKASENQSWGDGSNIGTGPPGGAGIPPDTPWPHDYPVGTSSAVFYFDNPFSPGETIATVGLIAVQPRRADSVLGATVGVREIVYYLITGTLGSTIVGRYDGTSQTTVASFPTGGGVTVIATGMNANGPFIIGTTGALGPHGLPLADYGAYMDEAGVWQVAAAGLQQTYVSAPPDPADPGTIDLEYCAIEGSPVSISGLGEVAGSFVVYTGGGGVWTEEVNTFVLEWNRTSDRWDRMVCFIEGSGVVTPNPADLCPGAVYGGSLRVLGNTYNCLVTENDPVVSHCAKAVQGARRNTVNPGVADLVRRYILGDILSTPYLWLEVVSGRLYVGGYFNPPFDVDCRIDPSDTLDPGEPAGNGRHAVYDVTPFSGGAYPPVVTERVYCVHDNEDLTLEAGAWTRYSHGCLPCVPAAETGEGFGSSDEGSG